MAKKARVRRAKPKWDPKLVRAHQRYVDAINSNSTARVMAVYDKGAVIMQPDGPAVQGMRNIRKWVQSYFTAYHTHWVKKSQVMWVAGDYGFDQGHDTAVDTPRRNGPLRGAPKVTWDVKGILIYKRQKNGEFKVYRDIWCSNHPPVYRGGALAGTYAPA